MTDRRQTSPPPPPAPPGRPLAALADPACAGMRLDAALARLFPGHSRSALARAAKSGLVLVDGRPARPSAQVKPGQRIEFTPPDKPGPDPVPAPETPLRIIHEDAFIVVADKQPGLPVHPGAGEPCPTLAGAVLARYPETASAGDPARPGVVHRLDKDTSGVIVMARTREALESLQAAFAGREARKRYLAFVIGLPPLTGTADSPVGRHPARRHLMAAGLPGGKPALSQWRVLRSFPRTSVSLVSARIHTGRTHQVRVHLAAAGFPVLGDPLYGAPQTAFLKERPTLAPLVGRQLLHARRLSIPHPAGGRASFSAPWPEDFVAVWRELVRLELL